MDKNVVILGKDFLKYRFNCTKCGEEILLRTSSGKSKDGHLGEFSCPFCGEAYNADIEPAISSRIALYPHVYLKNSEGEMLDLIMEGHELPQEQVERITAILSELGPAIVNSGALHVNKIPQINRCIEWFGKFRDRDVLDRVKYNFGDIENLKYGDKSINVRIKELLIACRLPDMNDSTVEVNVEIGCINPNRYEFNCAECNNKIDLRTGNGRYGALGEFKCPFCGIKYGATIDDYAYPHVYLLCANGKRFDLALKK